MASYLGELVALLIKKILVEWAELVAFEESLKVASAINISKVIFESDCANLVNRVKNCNKVADFLCNFAIKNRCNWNFSLEYPKDIHDLIMNDAITIWITE
ncbi:hypothetical protein Gohar_024879, partial [Gossypium harknessii]|nr:hypothetical protein [Gossypium harknessii]